MKALVNSFPLEVFALTLTKSYEKFYVFYFF